MMRKPSELTAGIGSAFLTIIMTPLIILNIFSGIVGGVWFAVIGQWKLIGLGLLLSFVMPWSYAIVSLPGMGLGIIAISLGEKGSKFGVSVFGFLASILEYVLLSTWCLIVFIFFIKNMGSGSCIPYLLWAYSTAMAPLGFMASKESPDSIGTAMGLFYAEISFVILAILWLFSIPFKTTIFILACVAVIFSLIITLISVQMVSANNLNTEEDGYYG